MTQTLDGEEDARPRAGTLATAGGRPFGPACPDVLVAYIAAMPDLRDFLSRFRPAGAPGAARAGVPADRSRELEAELGPVLALLAGTDAECGQLTDQARREAGQVTAQARVEAAAIAAAAGKRAEAMREEATRQAMAAARDEAATAVRDAERQAARTRELARQRMPALVSRAVDTIRQLRPDDQ